MRRAHDANDRPILPEEFGWLLETAPASRTSIRGLNGPARAALYLAAGYTGFRAGEPANLTADSFDVTAAPPALTVEAANSKRCRRDVQPIPGWVAERLAAWLAAPVTREYRPTLAMPARAEGKTPKTVARLWPEGWRQHAAELLRADVATGRRERIRLQH